MGLAIFSGLLRGPRNMETNASDTYLTGSHPYTEEAPTTPTGPSFTTGQLSSMARTTLQKLWRRLGLPDTAHLSTHAVLH